MAKRFTDSEKWKRPWFRKLSTEAKLTWVYLLDQCDHCGIWHADFELLSFQIGIKITAENLNTWFVDKLFQIENDKYLIPSFITFQYGDISELNPNSRVHKAVVAVVEKYQISKNKPFGNPCSNSSQRNKDNNKDTNKDKDKEPHFLKPQTYDAYCLRFGKDFVDAELPLIIAELGEPNPAFDEKPRIVRVRQMLEARYHRQKDRDKQSEERLKPVTRVYGDV